MIGMNRYDMKMYIKFVSNRLLKQLGYDELYKNNNDTVIENPFSFMEYVVFSKKKNFFEGRPTNYNTAIKQNPNDNVFSDNANF